MSVKLNWIGYKTLVRKEIKRIVRIWGQTIVPPAITMTLYFIIFGNLIGKRIGQMDGVDYMTFIVPGLVMMSVITNSYGNMVSSFFGAKFGRHIEELLVSPLPSYVIVAGYVSGAMTRGLIVGFVVSLIAMQFTHIAVHNILITVSIAILTSILFALAGMVNAIFAEKFDDIAIIPTFILTPLTYLGGVFYSISLLPEFWQKVSAFNPIFYIINGFRYGMLGQSDVSIGTAYVIILAFIGLLGGLCLWLVHTGKGLRS
ncbi:MAG: ABC transporter permease [Xanthomonadales bacterium]|nr:ABC transporter permease [Xanthomonadales bacterium]